jgi:hypothetical protein
VQAWQLWQHPMQWCNCAVRSVRHVESHFAMSAPESVERLYKLELGGGALLDIGVYPLSFIQVQPSSLDCRQLQPPCSNAHNAHWQYKPSILANLRCHLQAS